MRDQDHDLAFEVTTTDGHTYRVWASGRTEGFPEHSIILNRLPHLQRLEAVRALKAAGDAA